MEDVTFISAIIGALFGFIASWLTLRFNYRQLFAQTVSSNRMDWINVWRENISKLLACAEILHTSKEENTEYKKEFLEARGRILTRLNLNENNHVLMYGALTHFDYSSQNGRFYSQLAEIIELAQKILKPEWERVKKEAKGAKK